MSNEVKTQAGPATSAAAVPEKKQRPQTVQPKWASFLF